MVDRPRDRYGRPVPEGSPQVVPGVPSVASIEGDRAWLAAMAYLAQDLPFHAHEVFEQRWRCCPEPERAAWRACAQWAAALAQRGRGNEIGAARLAERALETLAGAEVVPVMIDVESLRRSAAELQVPVKPSEGSA